MESVLRPVHASCATDKGIRSKRNHPVGRGWLACLFIAGSGLLGCSVVSPIASLTGDDDIQTGTLRTSQTPLSSKLNIEDWRRAKAALAVALDPEGNGSAVRWDNPDSKASGSFAADGGFTVKNNLVCRPFKSTLKQAGQETTPKGTACRQGPGQWAIEEEAAVPLPARASGPPKAGGLF